MWKIVPRDYWSLNITLIGVYVHKIWGSFLNEEVNRFPNWEKTLKLLYSKIKRISFLIVGKRETLSGYCRDGFSPSQQFY